MKIAPEVFQLDDDEYAVVIADPVPAEQTALAEQAIADCPARRYRARTDRGPGELPAGLGHGAAGQPGGRSGDDAGRPSESPCRSP
ncbi:4Fe-4S single cluster domain protein [Mycobacterium avium subsp. avium 2285 (R)]|nr:4Fe-4S single cluster domain protein [Mycobacterium avium subsp. avium 2285 (R)]